MNRALLSQIKSTVKKVDTGTDASLGKRAPPPIKIDGTITDNLSLSNMCLSQVVYKVLANTTLENYDKVSAQLANVPSDVKMKILQYPSLLLSSCPPVLLPSLPSISITNLKSRQVKASLMVQIYMAVRRELGEFSSLATLTNFHITVFVAPRNHKLTNAWAARFAQVCTHLEVLDVRGCAGLSLSGIQQIVRACGEGLVHLDVSGVKPCSVPELIKVLQCTPNLMFLGVRDTDEDFSALTNLPEMCPRLQQLELSYNRGFSISLINSFIHSLAELQWLDLSWCSGVYDECVTLVAQTLGSRLVALNLELCCRGGGSVTDTSILELAKHCPNLAYLGVNALKFVTDSAICAIVQQCPAIKSLHISGCEVTDVGINAIATHCKHLELFSMVGLPEVTDDGVTKLLDQCEKLVLIDMGNCTQITPATKQKFISAEKLFTTHPETNSNCILRLCLLSPSSSSLLPSLPLAHDGLTYHKAVKTLSLHSHSAPPPPSLHSPSTEATLITSDIPFRVSRQGIVM